MQAVHGKRPVSVSLEELYRVRMPCLALQCTPPPGCFQACSCRMQDMPGHIHAALCQLPQCMQDLTCLWPALSTRSNELMGALHAQLVEDMCLHKMADRLYASLQKECDSHIGAQLSRLAAEQTMDPRALPQQGALQPRTESYRIQARPRVRAWSHICWPRPKACHWCC